VFITICWFPRNQSVINKGGADVVFLHEVDRITLLSLLVDQLAELSDHLPFSAVVELKTKQ